MCTDQLNFNLLETFCEEFVGFLDFLCISEITKVTKFCKVNFCVNEFKFLIWIKVEKNFKLVFKILKAEHVINFEGCLNESNFQFW